MPDPLTTTGTRPQLPTPPAVGNVLRTPRCTTIVGDFSAIPDGTWESDPPHVDDTYMSNTGLRRALLGGRCLLLIAARLASTRRCAPWAVVGPDGRTSPGTAEVRYKAPLSAADTVEPGSEALVLWPKRGGSGWFSGTQDRLVGRRRPYRLTGMQARP